MNTTVHLRKPISSRLLPVGLAALALVLLAGTIQAYPAQSSPEGNGSVAQKVPSAEPEAKQDKQAAASAKKAEPASEGFSIGPYQARMELEVGYRYSTKIDGNQEMYRSQTNLYQGARLFNTSLMLRSTPGAGLFDKLDFSLHNWGDPYNTIRFNMSRMDVYQFQASYRNLNYYNYISNFANPLLAQGNTFPQHNLNIDNRMSNFELRLFPTRKVVPFVGYSRNTGTGPGFTTMETDGNEFLLRTRWLYASNEYRGGVQFNLPTLNLTVEQGYRVLQNDTSVTDADQPNGNRSFPFFGQNVTLNSLDRGYHGRIKLPTTRLLAKFEPFKNLRMAGSYIYSMGNMESNLGEIRTGNLVSIENLLSYGTAADNLTGRAKRPNHNGSVVIEYSPFSRLTLTDSINTNNYHVSGTALLSTLYLGASSLLGPGPKFSTTINETLDTELTYNQVRNQAEFEFSLGKGLFARAGHRYTLIKISNNDSEDTTASEMSQQTGIFGFVFRPSRKVRFGLDYENTQTNQPLTRTDLIDYDQYNVDWRLGSWKGFTFDGKVSIRRNIDDVSDINFRSHDWNFVGGMSWEPNERFSLSVDYSRTDLFSSLSIILPQSFKTQRSLFDERLSGIGGSMGIGIYRGSRFDIGYRGGINRGAAPLEFHQPFASVLVPLGHGMALKPAWQYLGYSEKLFNAENYKTHLVTFSLVYTR